MYRTKGTETKREEGRENKEKMNFSGVKGDVQHASYAEMIGFYEDKWALTGSRPMSLEYPLVHASTMPVASGIITR